MHVRWRGAVYTVGAESGHVARLGVGLLVCSGVSGECSVLCFNMCQQWWTSGPSSSSREQELLSVHLEETEKPDTQHCLLCLLCLHCLVPPAVSAKISSRDDFLRWHLPILPATKDLLHLQRPPAHHYPGLPGAGRQPPPHSAGHPREVGECIPKTFRCNPFVRSQKLPTVILKCESCFNYPLPVRGSSGCLG